MSSFQSAEDGLTETGEEEPCRSCDAPTQTADYIGPICSECYEREEG